MAVVLALAHVIVTEKLHDEAYPGTLRLGRVLWDHADFISQLRAFARGAAAGHRRSGRGSARGAARLYATGGNAAIYYGLGKK